MKRFALFCLTLCALWCTASPAKASRPDTLWYRYTNRFTPNKVVVDLTPYDTITFGTAMMKLRNAQGSTRSVSYLSSTPGVFMFHDPGRILYKPSSMTGDFTSESNQWCFARSQESDHVVIFWESGCTIDPDYVLDVAEKAWLCYADELGFIEQGNSSTDTYKVLIRGYNTTDWIASGSGEDMAVGTLNLSPWAATARGGHTVAHEIGHTFQYLTNVDTGGDDTHGFNYGLGDNGWGGNGFWEDCANWMAYKVYPDMQFSDGEYFEGYLARCHLNLMHEDARYYNCFYQDYLCQLYGRNFIGRLWRESVNPEDPVDAIMRLCDLDTDGFAALMYDCFAHMCTWDIDDVRDAAAHRTGAFPNRLESVTVDGEEWFQASADYCPQNYGFNITELKLSSSGTLSLAFQGLAGADGYRSVNVARAGWRWGLVCLKADGTTEYGAMQTANEGSLTIDVASDVERIWLVVMGAPTLWWHHAWDSNTDNDEQWPYRVKLTGTRPVGSMKTYVAEDFAENYQRRDTTVTVEASLAYSSSSYTSVTVQYDTDAISEALGLTTAQLNAIECSSSANPRFVALGPTGTETAYTTTTTSYNPPLGHWFSTAGVVTSYGSLAAIFAEMYPATYTCNVGQYPGRLSAGKTYTVRHAVKYKADDGQTYTATIIVNLTIY